MVKYITQLNAFRFFPSATDKRIFVSGEGYSKKRTLIKCFLLLG